MDSAVGQSCVREAVDGRAARNQALAVGVAFLGIFELRNQQAAQVRAAETVQSFSHTRPNGSSFSTALTEAGVSYTRSGENIAYGQSTPQQVVQAWMNSSGHRANILNGSFTTIGVGYTVVGGTAYWAQLFTA